MKSVGLNCCGCIYVIFGQTTTQWKSHVDSQMCVWVIVISILGDHVTFVASRGVYSPYTPPLQISSSS